METAIFDGWRHLGLDSTQVLSKTPREFALMMAAQVERKYDEYERMAMQAMMMRAAYHKEKLRQSDLFKRPTGEIKSDKTAEDIEERQRAIIERLSKFEQFAGKFGGEEETNG